MLKLDKIRFYESLFIFVSTLIYLIRRYLEEETQIRQKIASLHNMDLFIYNEAGPYNHWIHSVLPMAGSTVFILGAWFIFHYYAFPRIKSFQRDDKTLIYVLLTVLLTAVGSFIYLYFKRYVIFYDDGNGTITNIEAYSTYRQRNVASITIVLLTIIGYYECLTQLYYYIHLRLSDDNKHRQVYISYFLLICLASFILGFALVGDVSEAFVDLPMRDPGGGGFWKFFYVFSISALIYILQKFCYELLFPSTRQSDWNRAGLYIGIYLVSCIVGTLVIWMISHDFVFYIRAKIVEVFLLVSIPPLIISYIRQVFTKEKIELQTQISTTSAELVALRMQINPHFLFNALNTLYAAALRENADKTSDGIQKLGDMMRFMLHENNQERIPLSKETEYLNNYISIQRMRIDEAHPIEIRINIQEPIQEIYIAPMLLNPFVENAFKHGISFRQPSWIYITLTLDATHLYFKVHNSIHPKLENDPEENRSGIGLENVRKRLELLYPGRHELTIQKSGQDYFASLMLQYC